MFLKSKTYATKAKSNTIESPHHPLVERFFYYMVVNMTARLRLPKIPLAVGTGQSLRSGL